MSPAPDGTGDAPSWRGLFVGARGRLVVGLLTIEFVGAVQALVTVAILPVVTSSLGGPRLAPWTFTASSCAAIAAFAVAGRWVDRAGPRVALGTGMPLTAIGLLGAALAPTMAFLVGARAVEGFGLGLQGTVALSAVATMFPPAVRPRLLALTSAMWVLPGVLAPALGVALASTVGWRWVFAGFLPLLAVAAILAIPALRTLDPGGAAAAGAGGGPARPPLTAGAVASRLALAVGAAALLAVLQVPGGTGPEVGLGVTGLVLVGWGIRALARAELRGVHGRRLAIAMVAGFCVGGAYFGTDSVLPLVVHAHGGSAYVAGLALTAASITWSLGSLWQSRLARSRPLRAILLGGALLLAAGIVATSLVQARSGAGWIALVPPALGLAALGMGLAYPTVSLLAVGGDQGDRGVTDVATADAAGLVLLAGSLGPAVTIGSLGVLASTGGRTGETVSAVVLVALALAAALVAGAGFGWFRGRARPS